MRRHQQEYVHMQNVPRGKKNRILCVYCHQFHLRDDVPDGVCPKMRAFASELQRKHAYVCEACGGEGTFEKRVETKLLESAKRYEERWKEWMESNQNNQQLPAPQRRVIKFEQTITQIVCSECHGSGNIYRMIHDQKDIRIQIRECSQKLSVNPVWLRYRMKPRHASGYFHCSICLMEEGFQDKNFKLHCSHQFHFRCIMKWLKLNDSCPICRHVDPYIDLTCIDKSERLEESDEYQSERTFNAVTRVMSGIRRDNREFDFNNIYNYDRIRPQADDPDISDDDRPWGLDE